MSVKMGSVQGLVAKQCVKKAIVSFYGTQRMPRVKFCNVYSTPSFNVISQLLKSREAIHTKNHLKKKFKLYFILSNITYDSNLQLIFFGEHLLMFDISLFSQTNYNMEGMGAVSSHHLEINIPCHMMLRTTRPFYKVKVLF